MSEMGFTERYRDELTAAALGYGYGIMSATLGLLWVKGIAERDAVLFAVIAVSLIPSSACHRAMKEHVALMGKDDGERAAVLERVFSNTGVASLVQWVLILKMFLIG